ncbi:alpha/beta hydrolase family protein [Sphingomonas abaci]|uniref:Dipeptidyl aminopeptidase/acylaminoacyl peptidase n=1 Tax=Sphingomonas abaci TaxID=237611 RepID=A0A7W7AIR8_9SPHN|nr:S9 family peptidase [Sphingomonas abaci]MBB4617788.1 dipeptidyl aminopeptidase/acylaminoacyl peptidase [Sphingomonas abaci]
MPRSLLLLLSATLLSSGAMAAAQQATPEATRPDRRFGPRDAFALSQASDVRISPDGKRIAYTRATGDIMTDGDRRQVWLVDVATGRQTPLGVPGSSRPRWSPDGQRLAYAARGEDDRPQIFVRWLASGASAAITALPESPADIAWSPDGRLIGFTMFVPGDGVQLGTPLAKPEGAHWAEPIKIIDQVHYREDGGGYLRPGYNHVFVVSADGGAARQLTFGPQDDGGSVAWTADGRSLLIAGHHGKDPDRDPMNSDVFAVDAATGALRRLTDRQGPDEEPVASPDGRLIAYVGFEDRLLGYQNQQLSVMNADGSGARVLTAGLDRSVDHPQWAADGRSIYVQYVDHGDTKVARVGLDGQVTTVATGLAGGELDRPYSGGDFSIARDGAIAFTQGDTTHPADVAVTRGGGAPRRLTDLNRELFAGKALAQVRPLAVTSSAGGLPIDAWMMTPPDYDPARKYPLILEIHGGPFASYAPVWSTDDQLYAAAGYVVVYANPRGSTSYGENFANLIHHNYPSSDYDDLMSVVDAAIAAGPVDRNNLFVTGGSGGGLLTAWIVGKTDRFNAAVTQKPVINWTSEVLTTDGYTSMARYWFGKMPWEDPEQYWRRSPLSLVGNVKTPTAVVVGEEDHRTPPSESEQYYAALQIRGVPTVLIRVPSASHGGLADRPSQLVAKNAAILAWFDRYRKR